MRIERAKKFKFCIIWKSSFFIWFWWAFSKLFPMKNATNIKYSSLGIKGFQNNQVYSRLTASSTLLCPAHCCVQYLTVSSKILCLHSIKYFPFQRAAAVPECVCEVPQFTNVILIWMFWSLQKKRFTSRCIC